jgi:hypothetical protein
VADKKYIVIKDCVVGMIIGVTKRASLATSASLKRGTIMIKVGEYPLCKTTYNMKKDNGDDSTMYQVPNTLLREVTDDDYFC